MQFYLVRGQETSSQNMQEFDIGEMGALVRKVDLSKEHSVFPAPDDALYHGGQEMFLPSKDTVDKAVDDANSFGLTGIIEELVDEVGKEQAGLVRIHGNPFYEVIEVVEGTILMFEMPLLTYAGTEIRPKNKDMLKVIRNLKEHRGYLADEDGNPYDVVKAIREFVLGKRPQVITAENVSSQDEAMFRRGKADLYRNKGSDNVYMAPLGVAHGYQLIGDRDVKLRVSMYALPQTEELIQLFRHRTEYPKSFKVQ